MARTETKTAPNPQKVGRVAELKQRIDGADALLLTEYRGLTVSEITELRRSLREGGTQFAVVKNTLMQRAVADAGHAELAELLTGPSAVAFVTGDVVAAAKAIRAASKQYPSLVLKGGLMDGEMLDAAQAGGLADLESREEMLSKIAGLLKSDMAKAARVFVSAQSRFLSLLEAYREKVPAGDAEAEAAPAPEPAAGAEAEPEAETAPEPPAERAAGTGTETKAEAEAAGDTEPETPAAVQAESTDQTSTEEE